MPQPSPERLRGAAKLIREVGHVKGRYRNVVPAVAGSVSDVVTVGYCAVGALSEVANVAVFDVRAEARYLSQMLGYDPDTQIEQHFMVSAWNDLDDTSPEDVATLLEQAAEKLEADR